MNVTPAKPCCTTCRHQQQLYQQRSECCVHPTHSVLVSEMRAEGGECGPEGRLFEPKEGDREAAR